MNRNRSNPHNFHGIIPSTLKMAGVIILSAITGPIAIALILCCIGFGCAGVTGGSCAAGCHSSIGNVAAGSCFACKS